MKQKKGDYCFDTAGKAWRKKGDWSLPFHGLAHYVPEDKLWFGLSNKKDGNIFCAFGLTSANCWQSPPVALNVWEDLWLSKEWLPITSSIVHLGSGRFCIARLFRETHEEQRNLDDVPCKMYSVFTAVEFEPDGSEGKGPGLVKYTSQCYSLGNKIVCLWVL
jgi:hypothetical protein